MWIGNLMLVVLNLPLVGLWVSLLRVPYRLLFPAIVVFSAVGIYSSSNTSFDVGQCLTQRRHPQSSAQPSQAVVCGTKNLGLRRFKSFDKQRYVVEVACSCQAAQRRGARLDGPLGCQSS